MSLFSKQSTTNVQEHEYFDSSANAGGDDSVALGSGAALDVSNRSTNVSAESGGLSLANAQLTLNTLSDSGAIDLAKELSLAAVGLAGKQTEELKEYVASNQNFARSIASDALAVASGQPLPATSNKLFWIGGGIVALVLFLVLGRGRVSAR